MYVSTPYTAYNKRLSIHGRTTQKGHYVNSKSDTYYILYYTCLSGQNPQTQLYVSEKPTLACTVFGAFFQKFALFSVHRRGD